MTVYRSNERYLETGDIMLQQVGNGPILVDREDRAVHPLGTGRNIEAVIAEYVRSRAAISRR